MNANRICPNCGKEYQQRAAISRKDNKTEICPDCGLYEAVAAAGITTEAAADIMAQIKAAQQ